MISFGLAPRINACGRMGHVEDAIEIFSTGNAAKAEEITHKLNEYNKQRQDTEKDIYTEAIQKIQDDDLEKYDAIVVRRG